MIVQELKKSEEQFRLLLESVTDYAIFMLDPQGHVTSWNAGAERLLGYSEAEVIGESGARFFSPEDVHGGMPERELNNARDDGRVSTDRWYLRKDGTRFWANAVVTPVGDGALRGYVKVMRDLTEQKLAHEELRKSEERYRKLAEQSREMNQRKDRFLAMLSHELRNPLASILSALQLMRQDGTDNSLRQQARSIVERQMNQLVRLVDDLLDVSRLTAGKITLRYDRVELRGMLERAVESRRPLIEARKHELTLALTDHPVWLRADPARLEQIVVNLLTNAAKYTPEGGSISVILQQEDDQAVVRVRDTGIGIDPEQLPHIFELFAQAEQGLNRSQGGLGVGLALVKALVEMHEGSVNARSAGLGRGCEFSVRLPVCEAPKTDQAAGTRTRAATAKSLRLLLVDDNADAADSLAMLLRLNGHEVKVAYTGPAALQAALDYQPNVILLDIGLPGMDGYEVAERLRARPHTGKALIIIAMTGYGQESDKERTKEAGFDRHLVKPVDPAQLQNLLGSFVEPR